MTRWPDDGPLTEFSSLDAFLENENPVEGNISIMHGNRAIQLHFRRGSENTTLVMFSGAVASSVREVPVFSGRRAAQGTPASLLLISDPTLKSSRRLTLGWYAGSRHHPDLQADLTRIIKCLAAQSHVVLAGGSGGGFAALEQATRLPAATVLASNPQTDILRYLPNAVDRYLKQAWGLDHLAGHEMPFTNSVVDGYRVPTSARVVYVQNIGDIFHVSNHWLPFRDAIHPDNALLSVTRQLGKGHVGPNRDSFAKLVSVVTSTPDWDELTSRLNTLDIS